MKVLRSLVAILLMGGCLALLADRVGVSPARATTPDLRVVAISALGAGSVGCAGDTNNDNIVNGADLSVLLSQFGTSIAPGTGADFNGSGTVNGADLSVLLSNFGATCCPPGFGDCNGNAADGCETNLNTSRHNCGACGNVCPLNIPNAAIECVNGQCQFVGCFFGWENCNGTLADGCEVEILSDPSNCDACGHACTFDNAVGVCITGNCVFSHCLAGYYDCNGIATDGCEVSHAESPNTCATAQFLGAFCGNLNCGNFCPSSSTTTTVSQGLTSKWFAVTALDCSTCASVVQHTVRLHVPANIDYDLYIYVPCGNVIASSTNLTGILDQTTFGVNDPFFSDGNQFTYQIEVRYYDGASCQPWQLEVVSRSCP